MASFIYLIRTNQKDADVKIRIRFNAYLDKKKVSAYAISGIVLAKKAWDIKKGTLKTSFVPTDESEKKGNIYYEAQESLDEIKDFVFQRHKILGDAKITSGWLQGVVDEYWNIRKLIIEDEKRIEAEIANKETLGQYITRYQKEIADGSRLTNKNTIYKQGTVKAVKASMVQFKEYQKATKHHLNFEDIDLAFYRKYTAWLTKKGYTTNSIGKCIKDLKTILDNAKDDGLHSNEEYKNKKFRVTAEEADNIYLTQAELNAIAQVDLSGMAKGYTDARDVFLAGCYLAQRVGDYNHLTPDNIVVEKSKQITSDNKVAEIEVTYIVITQQKTTARVKIPANKAMRELLTRYDNQLPYIWEQKLNQYIKVVARKAGITQLEQVSTTKAGSKDTVFVEKCDLVKSHTARRTGATLMYLSGMDVYDICKITGHTSIKNLRKYIKADELDIAEKINKYNYFN